MLSSFASWVAGGEAQDDGADAEAPLEALGVDEESDEASGRHVGRLLQQFSVLLEYERLQDSLPPGVYVVPSLESEMVWHGAAFMRHGLYRGGVFRFRLRLPEDYPDSPPEVFFDSEVFHPMVDPETGRLDIEVVFPEWRPGRDYASFVLPHLHRALLRREYFAEAARPPLNLEARRLFLEDPAAFAERAAHCAALSLESVQKTPAGCSLQFRPGPDEAEASIMEALRATDATSGAPEERKAAFVDWFCNHYAGSPVRTNVTDGNVETMRFTPVPVVFEEPPPRPDDVSSESDDEEERKVVDATALVAAEAKSNVLKR